MIKESKLTEVKSYKYIVTQVINKMRSWLLTVALFKNVPLYFLDHTRQPGLSLELNFFSPSSADVYLPWSLYEYVCVLLGGVASWLPGNCMKQMRPIILMLLQQPGVSGWTLVLSMSHIPPCSSVDPLSTLLIVSSHNFCQTIKSPFKYDPFCELELD